MQYPNESVSVFHCSFHHFLYIYDLTMFRPVSPCTKESLGTWLSFSPCRIDKGSQEFVLLCLFHQVSIVMVCFASEQSTPHMPHMIEPSGQRSPGALGFSKASRGSCVQSVVTVCVLVAYQFFFLVLICTTVSPIRPIPETIIRVSHSAKFVSSPVSGVSSGSYLLLKTMPSPPLTVATSCPLPLSVMVIVPS